MNAIPERPDPHRVVEVIVTADDHDWLVSQADRLLDQHLIAAARITPGVTTVYDGDGQRHHETESCAALHTTGRLASRVCDLIARDHPYDVPGIHVLPVERIDTAYTRWVWSQTKLASARLEGTQH